MITVRTAFFFMLLVMISSCSGSKETPPPDPLGDFDTLYVGDGSMLTIDRYRKYLNKNALFKIGKMKMQLSIDDLKTGVKAHYLVDSGMLVYNKEFFTAQCFVSTEQIKTLHVDSTQQPGMETPSYLLNGNKKYIVIEYKGNFYPRERKPTASCSLTINDSTGLLTDAESWVNIKNNLVSFIHTKAYVDGLKWKLYEPIKGEEIQKDSIQLEFNIGFEKKQPVQPKKI